MVLRAGQTRSGRRVSRRALRFLGILGSDVRTGFARCGEAARMPFSLETRTAFEMAHQSAAYEISSTRPGFYGLMLQMLG